jgi:hypothetical protein
MKDNLDYDYIAAFHSKAFEDKRAHYGPNFLGWHKQYIARYVKIFKKIFFF